MATSIYDLEQNVFKAKSALAEAKKSGKKGNDLKPYNKAVKDSEAILAKAKSALGGK